MAKKNSRTKRLSKLKHCLSIQVVILSQVLACDSNVGYQNFGNMEVYGVNGVHIKNIRHLVELVENITTEYVRFDLEMQR